MWRKNDMLYKRGSVFHYDFAVGGRRYRGTTREKSGTRARKLESLLMAQAVERKLPAGMRRAPTLRELGARFNEWLLVSQLTANTVRYYRVGWSRLEQTRLAAMRIDHITSDDIGSVAFDGSAPWVNQGLRTLRRMLNKAVEWKLLGAPPKIKLHHEERREGIIDADTEAAVLAQAKQPLHDVFVIMQDCGARPEEVFRIRIENIDWSARTIFNPHGKTKKARRYLPISDRMLNLLMVRAAGAKEGWLFPSKKAKCGHLTTVAKQWREARKAAGLPDSLVLYCARHSFGTAAYAATRNLAAVMDAMGHTDVRLTMRYQHQDTSIIRDAINQRNTEALRHKERHSQEPVQ
jgi:integrase